MNRITKILLGLALIYVPATSASQCFSETLDPSYPCCKGDKVVYTDESGDWGIENDKWCGIGTGTSMTCFSNALGYPCCKGDKVVYTDESGKWGVENGEWCGISEDDSSDSCFATVYGYPCCETCKVVYSDENGDWGKENKKWCGIKNKCNLHSDKNIVNSHSHENLDFAFLKLENQKANMLYSPLSIKYALNMLQEGASNNTYTEINQLIGNNELTKYTSNDKILSFANGLFIRDTFYDNVKTGYINTLKKKYDAEVIQDEFKDANNVNQWIEDKTLGIIKDMIKDAAVQDPLSVMILLNALAIDMEWSSQFTYRSTHGENFYKDNGEIIKATMMYKSNIKSPYFSFYINDDLTVLTMDLKKYKGVQLEFMAIMPENNLSGFVDSITKQQISEIDENLLSSADPRDGINVMIPKFKFKYDLDFKNDLKKLGIKDAFIKYEADFSNMSIAHTPDEKLYISDALHKADIEFSEDGVKAAAVTVFIMTMAGSAYRPERIKEPINVYIDKPFMFLIRDKETKDIWFTGTVYEPNLWENDEAEYEVVYKR